MIDPASIDDAVVLAELADVFHDYEQALMSNDVDRLNRWFWEDARVTRYGIADRQWGIDEIKAYRAATPAPAFTRTLHQLRLHAFGPDLAVAQVEFVRSDTTLRGFQTQTWARLPEGWRIVAAHVSMIAFDGAV